MPLFPKIQSPCPYQGRLSEIMDGDVCRMCHRQVFELTHMTDGERVAFLAGCEEEVCVSYALRLGPAMRAAAVAAALAIPTAAYADEIITVTGGGIKDPSRVEMIELPAEAAVPELPVVYEEEPAAQARGQGQAGEGAGEAPAPSRR
jgi:predicted Fe-S protein YdhL (DUF1289 family)